MIYGVLGVKVGANYESMASLWLCNKKLDICNIFSATVCWSLWKPRNCLCFRGVALVSMKSVWYRLEPMIGFWRILVPLKMLADFEDALVALEKIDAAPEQLPWRSARVDAGRSSEHMDAGS
jgi:hypothetical protein